MLDDQIDINIITDTINVYIEKASKANIFNWQLLHHHGAEGIYRAETLGRWCDIAWHNMKLDALLKSYLNTKNYIFLADQLAYVNSQNPKKEEFKIVTAEMYTDAKLLAGGNNTKSSLRYYINSVYNSPNQQQSLFFDLGSCNLRSGIFRSSIFGGTEEDSNSDLTLHITDLGSFDEKLGVSAHDVHRYKKVAGDRTKFYFLKYISSDDEKNDALAEVVYSKLWRFLIGERASDSRLVFDNNNQLIGICSVGLDNFKEFAKMTLSDQDQTKGLASLLICVCLFIENDFHIYNYGKFNFYGRSYYGKIDHDYIITKWQSMKLEASKFKIDDLARILNNSNINLLVTILERLRFRPTSVNSITLRAGHEIRALVSDRSNTTTNNDLVSQILSKLVNKENRDDLNRIKSSIKQRANKMDENAEFNMNAEINRIGKLGSINTNKAKEIFEFFVARIRDLGNKLN
ncbi:MULTISPECIES: hypothetical protein [unclassified Francisella]|uniref:hypothetical protein n=1 Tax=unclassified Francisella TaxID=2610885 RepID=UPI002E308E56|nr:MULTISPECIES: hypothetical protein [unclassified Francisella]MED7818907.1 hypothetical protein [Francisella sp. 19S2-4]MED7829744.1 hypothetical protein [Francisella sp. 19S2-10]